MSLREDNGRIVMDDEKPGWLQRWFRPAAFAASACAWMIALLWLLFVLDVATWLLGVVGIAFFLFARILRLNLSTLRIEGRDGGPSHSDEGLQVQQRLVGAWTTIVIGIVSLVLWFFVFRTDGWLFAGLILSFFGVNLLVSAIRSSTWPGKRRGIITISICAGAFFGGLFAISQDVTGWALSLLAAGLILSPVGLSWLSADFLRDHPDQPSPRALLVSGSILLAIGIVGLLLMSVPVLLTLMAAVALFLLIGAIASDTSVDAIFVVVTIALVWSLAPRGVPATAEVTPSDGESVIVALGDSYMSGEGADEFFDGTNTRGDNECRRAPTAYAPLVTQVVDDVIPHDLVFLACSGAETRHIFRDVAYPGEPIRTDGPAGPGLNQLSQWRWLRESLQLDVRLVIVSIGGNDALFGEFGRVCALPGDCSELAKRWLDNLETTVAANVAMAYREIRTTFPNVPVVAVPYPSPLRERACDWSTLSNNEHVFIHGFLRELNNVLEQAAINEGLYYLQAMETALEDRNLRICDQGPTSVGVNFLAANPVGGQLSDTLNPRHWFHNSLHPNHRGHEAMRDTLAEWIRAHPDVGPAQPADNPTKYEVASIETIMGRPEFRHCGRPDSGLAHCDGSSWDWAGARFVGFVWKGIVPLPLVAVGALLVWLHVIGGGRFRQLVDRLRKFAERSAESNRSELRQRARHVLNVLRGRGGSSEGR